MREGMPDISFERSMNHNYMILSKCDFFGRETDKVMITGQECFWKITFLDFCQSHTD